MRLFAVRDDARRLVIVRPRSRRRSVTARSPARVAYGVCRSGAKLFMLWALRRHDARQLAQLPAHHDLAPDSWPFWIAGGA